MKNPVKLQAWHDLTSHQLEIEKEHMRNWFNADAKRFERFSFSAADIFLDYSRNLISEKTLSLLIELAKKCELPQKIAALFQGELVNNTEQRPALHMALRDQAHTDIKVNGDCIAPLIRQTQEKMRTFVDNIHNHSWRGVTGKAISHIVNIGIGGSYAGPMMGMDALKEYALSPLQFHFISSVDKTQLDRVLALIDPETTLFIISSKSFTTIETLTNTQTVLSWMKNQLAKDPIQHHFIAVTSAQQKAREMGIPDENIFPLWDWVGGRYSVWSAIGLPLQLMIGNQQFADFLAGGYAMDQHFQQAELKHNLPVIMALLSIWYTNFFGASTEAIIPYAHRLRYFIPYLQQAEMESNGKGVDKDGTSIDYTTGPILFGEEGVIGQHAYHQLLHQGTHLIPVDFIVVGKGSSNAHPEHQDVLIASALSQAQALMRGKTLQEAKRELLALQYSEESAATLAQHQIIPGNKPSNILYLERLTPKTLGALIALYEHKIFVQGAIWNINSFDQWGVELGKQLLPAILGCIKGATTQQLDSATAGLIARLQQSRH